MFQVNFPNVANSVDSSAVVRRTAMQIMNTGYLTLGDWLKSLGTDELSFLCSAAEIVMEAAEHGDEFQGEARDAYTEFVLLSAMLTTAEGEEDLSDETISKNANAIIMLSITEGLCRKGLVELYHNKISFTGKEKIAKLKDQE